MKITYRKLMHVACGQSLALERLEAYLKIFDSYIDKYEKYQIQNRERQKRYRDKTNSEKENSNVTITLDNAKEKNRIEKNTKEIREEDIKRKEEESGFREYKL